MSKIEFTVQSTCCTKITTMLKLVKLRKLTCLAEVVMVDLFRYQLLLVRNLNERMIASRRFCLNRLKKYGLLKNLLSIKEQWVNYPKALLRIPTALNLQNKTSANASKIGAIRTSAELQRMMYSDFRVTAFCWWKKGQKINQLNLSRQTEYLTMMNSIWVQKIKKLSSRPKKRRRLHCQILMNWRKRGSSRSFRCTLMWIIQKVIVNL